METIVGGILLAHVIQGLAAVVLMFAFALVALAVIRYRDNPHRVEKRRVRLLVELAKEKTRRERLVADYRRDGYTDRQLRIMRLID